MFQLRHREVKRMSERDSNIDRGADFELGRTRSVLVTHYAIESYMRSDSEEFLRRSAGVLKVGTRLKIWHFAVLAKREGAPTQFRHIW